MEQELALALISELKEIKVGIVSIAVILLMIQLVLLFRRFR